MTGHECLPYIKIESLSNQNRVDFYWLQVILRGVLKMFG